MASTPSHHLSTKRAQFAAPNCRCLERRFGILQKHLKVRLVPLTSLGRRLESIVLAAERIIARGRTVRSTIRLTTRLDPHKRIHKRRACAGCRPDSKASTVDVAPVTPLLAQATDSIASSIYNGLSWHTSRLEFRREELYIELLVLRLVPLCIRGLGELSW